MKRITVSKCICKTCNKHNNFTLCLQILMDILENDSYKEGKACFENDFDPVMKEVTSNLNKLKEEIQKEQETQTEWNILYSLCGCLGGTFTFAALVFAPLATVGFALGTTSSVASFLHISVKIQIINKRLTFVERTLERFKDVCEDMKRQLISLNRDIKEQIEAIQQNNPSAAKRYKRKQDEIEVAIEKIEKLHQHSSLLDDDMISKVKQFGKSLDGVISGTTKAAKLYTKALVKTAAASIVVNLTSLFLEYDNLYNFEKGRLCDEAHKVEAINEEIGSLNKYLIKVFQ